MNKINDFGEKIGGARKDIWKNNGISEEDLYQMNEAEKRLYVNRDFVWPLADAKYLVNQGLSAVVVYWGRQVRRCVRKEPLILRDDDFDAAMVHYVQVVNSLKRMVMAVKSINEIYHFYSEIYDNNDKYLKGPWRNIVSSRQFLNTKFNLPKYKAVVQQKNWPFVEKKATGSKKRKSKFIPPQLESIKREGKDYRHGIHVTPNIWQKRFKFRGVEFGNWLSQKDRQASMDYCFDALCDLADILMIEDSDIAFDGKLALAFGARGVNSASAHYEPARKVINLTKMHGAGCTAHEWMHALDDELSHFCGVSDGKMASETSEKYKLPDSFVTLVTALKYDAEGHKTDYYRGSAAFDEHYSKEPFGFWGSDCEMLARAFACYVKDSLALRSDYLIGHADAYKFQFDDEGICAYPQGDERELYNELFDQLFYDLKKLGLFHKRSKRTEDLIYEPEPLFTPIKASNTPAHSVALATGTDGQMQFLF